MQDNDFLLEDLLVKVREYADAHKGKIYAPICHEAFDGIPYEHGPERFDMIAPYLPEDAKTALDIGSHWGYFAHRLEDIGLEVTAAEMNPSYLEYLREIRQLCGKTFAIHDRSVFEMRGSIQHEVVLALNIFHHFIKARTVFDEFVDFLSRLDCKIIFFQAHNPEEGQMKGAYHNYAPNEFAEFVRSHSNLSRITRLGALGKRPVYAIAR
jgi:2-polyprenyl-3-methyl-5-hydroxy-6-metoxy-1,4-benzoquinol methylase